MKAPLIILSPPRSFSSVVSTMIGEHPDLYGFPELHLTVGDTVQAVLDREYKAAGRYTGPPGVLRSLAELHDGIQTTGTIVRAAAWLNERRAWSTKKLMDYLLERVDPLIGVEKSPVTCQRQAYLERIYALYPDAFYLHLTRHPVSARKSMQEFSERKRSQRDKRGSRLKGDRLIGWYHMHGNILNFTSRLPLGQTMRIRGEYILSDPDVYLPQIAEWLGVRTDAEAIDAMKHPENSPYACFGPEPARGGNDPKFMRSPALRFGRIREPSLVELFEKEDITWFSDEFAEVLGKSELTLASQEEIQGQIAELASVLGYE